MTTLVKLVTCLICLAATALVAQRMWHRACPLPIPDDFDTPYKLEPA